MKDTYLNLACYQFADLDDLPALRAHLLTEGRRLDMRGTILLTTEGVNVMLSGLEANARAFAAVLRAIPGLEAMHIKESRSAEHGFNRFLVKIKKETITFRQQMPASSWPMTRWARFRSGVTRPAARP